MLTPGVIARISDTLLQPWKLVTPTSEFQISSTQATVYRPRESSLASVRSKKILRQFVLDPI
jgi:hypothetical protein